MSSEDVPRIEIVRGGATAEDIAVVAALVAAMSSGGDTEAAPVPVRGWADRRRQLRRRARRGDGWSRI